MYRDLDRFEPRVICRLIYWCLYSFIVPVALRGTHYILIEGNIRDLSRNDDAVQT